MGHNNIIIKRARMARVSAYSIFLQSKVLRNNILRFGWIFSCLNHTQHKRCNQIIYVLFGFNMAGWIGITDKLSESMRN